MRITQDEARAILVFRRSAAAPLVRAVVERELAACRERYQTSTADELNRVSVLENRNILAALFDNPLEL